jgi:hypothetical protein
MSYLDIPVLRSAGFFASASGSSWFGTDNENGEWQAYEENGKLIFIDPDRESMELSREVFDEHFGNR